MLVSDAIKKLETSGYCAVQMSRPNRLVVSNSPADIGGGSSHMIVGSAGDVSDKKVQWFLNRKPMLQRKEA